MIWRFLCENVASCKKANHKEKDFENKIDLFFQAYLGWKELNGDIQRQVKIEFAHTKGYADIILFWDDKEEIIIELKKPNNIQVNGNVRQLTDYMKLKRCNFGLYIGEKLELYYDKDDKSKKRVDPVLVASIDFIEGSTEGEELIALLNRDTYSSEKFEEYCRRKIELTKVAKYWTSPEGTNKLYQYILDHSQLSESLIDNLAQILKINVSLNESKTAKVVKRETIVPKPIVPKAKELPKSTKESDKTQYSLDGSSYVRKARFVLEVAKAIIEYHPTITYQELKNILPLRSKSNLTLITKEEWLKKSEDAQKRYCRKEGDLLKDINGVEFYVSTQWTKQDIDDTIYPVIKQYGWKVYEK